MPPKKKYSSAATRDDAASTEGLTFDLDDVTFTCHGRISAFDLAEFAGPVADAGTAAEINDPGVLRILADFTHALLGDPTYRQFTEHRRRHHTPDEVAQSILFDLVEEATSRPSPSPPASPPGRPAPVPAPAVSPSPDGPPEQQGQQEPEPGPPAIEGLLVVPGSEADWMAELAALGDVAFVPPPEDAEPEQGPAGNRTLSFAHPERGVTISDPEQDTPPG